MASEVFALVGRITMDGLAAVTSGLNQVRDRAGAVADGIGKFGTRAKAVGEAAGSAGQSLTTRLSLPLAAVGAAGAMAANDMQVANGRIAAGLGISQGAAQKLTGVASNLWKAGFGASVTEAADAVTSVGQNIQGLNPAQLQAVTEQAFIMRDAFGADITESTRTASVMMKNFGIDSTQAMDLLTVGYQKGGDYSGELLDTMREYGPQFASMGFSATDMMNSLIKGSTAGAWNLDKVGDSMKEFNLRAVDGSKTTATGFKAIGLDAGDMATKIAAGGDSAQNAFIATTAALSKMKDPVKQNAAGVALFGTQWEDVRSKVIVAMGDSTNVLGKVEGATKRAGDAAYNNFGSRLTVAWRETQTALLPLGNTLLDMADAILPKVSAAASFLSTAFTNMTPTGRMVAVIFGMVAAAIGPMLVVFGAIAGAVGNIIGIFGRLGPILNLVKTGFTIFRTALMVLTGPVGIVIAVITALVAIGVYVYQNWSTIGPRLVAIFNGIKAGVVMAITILKVAAMAIFNGIKAGLIAIVIGIAMGAIAAFNSLKNGAIAVINALKFGAIAVINVLKFGAIAAFNALKFGVMAVINGLRAGAVAVWNGLRAGVMAVINGLRIGAVAAWSFLRSGVMAVINGLRAGAVAVWNGLRAGVMAVINGLRAGAVAAWSALRSGVLAVINGLRSGAIAAWNALRSGVLAVINGLRSGAIAAWNGIKNGVVSVIKALYNSARSNFNAIKSTATSVFGSVKSAIMNPINAAVNGVRTAVGRIKGFFSGLSVKLPNIKLPHFSMSGKFSLNPPSVPKLGIKWYKEGAIFGGPSVIGVGEQPGVKEMVTPLRGANMLPFASAIAAAMPNTGPGGGDNFYITIDPKNIREMNDLVNIVYGFRQSVRRGGGEHGRN